VTRVVEKQSAKIEVLNKEISECKRVNQKLTMIAKWNVRATQSALKNSQDMLEILEDLYGDSATE
jgi:thiamine biosynthesis lipoprotein ApbE